MSEDKKELNENDLDKVTGGFTAADADAKLAEITSSAIDEAARKINAEATGH